MVCKAPSSGTVTMGAGAVGCNGTAGLKFESGTGNGGGVTVGVKWVGAGNTHAQLMLETVPSDPNREEYRQGNTMGPAFRHWRRAKIGRRLPGGGI